MSLMEAVSQVGGKSQKSRFAARRGERIFLHYQRTGEPSRTQGRVLRNPTVDTVRLAEQSWTPANRCAPGGAWF
jgi:hypothetical protein